MALAAALRRLFGLGAGDEAALSAAIGLHEAGDLDAAATAYTKILQRNPRHAGALHLLGLTDHQRGDHDNALARIEQAIAIDASVALYHFNRGNVLVALERPAAACAAFGDALHLKPDYPAAAFNLAKTLAQQQRDADAIAIFRTLPADLPGLAHDLANALLAEGSRRGDKALIDESIALLQASWQSAPDPVEARIALGWALQQRARWSEAAGHYEGALAARPGIAKAHNNLANCYNALGRIGEAVAHYRELYRLAPDFPDALTSVIANLNYDPRVTPRQVFDEHRAWSDRVAAPLYPQALQFGNDPHPDRPLRVGFISPDLRRHPVAYIFTPVLAAFDRSGIEATCYYNFSAADAFTARIKSLSARWRDVAGFTDDELYQLVRADGIDVLVDLAGHTTHNRLAVFARRAAPVQVSWLGYFNTTGLATMDCFVSDPHSSPKGQEEYFTERLVRLPHTRFCYEPPEGMPPVNALPAASSGAVTFGCFNNLSKLNSEVLALWAHVLDGAPGSRLVLQAAALDDAPNRERFRSMAAAAGIPAGRLELRGFVPAAEAPLAYHGIDIALDPFPFCGGMTSFESLWMGVPVVTLQQPMIAGRQTLAMLACLGLEELVAANSDDYVRIATALAADLPRLAALRNTLRPRFAASPLQDYTGFAHAFEQVLRERWRHWVAAGMQRSGTAARAGDAGPLGT